MIFSPRWAYSGVQAVYLAHGVVPAPLRGLQCFSSFIFHAVSLSGRSIGEFLCVEILLQAGTPVPEPFLKPGNEHRDRNCPGGGYQRPAYPGVRIRSMHTVSSATPTSPVETLPGKDIWKSLMTAVTRREITAAAATMEMAVG